MLFFEAFEGLKLRKDLENVFLTVTVDKVTNTSDKSSIRIHISSNRLIDKSDIYYVQDEIKRQLFSDTKIAVIIMEKYNLSSQYTPKNFFDLYKESIEKELARESRVLSVLFKNAKKEFIGEDTFKIVLYSDSVGTMMVRKLEDYLYGVFAERCGLKIEIDISIEEAKESRFEKQKEQLVSNISNQIFGRLDENKKSEESKEAAASLENNKEGVKVNADNKSDADNSINSVNRVNVDNKLDIEKQPPKDEGTKPSEKAEVKGANNNAKTFDGKSRWNGQSKFGSYNSKKWDDDPNVIYGRGFEGELTKISDINENTGNVMFKGQIMSVDFREIKGERTIVSIALTDFTDSIKCKIFVKNDQLDAIKDNIKEKAFIKINGVAMFDSYEKEVSITSVNGIMKAADTRVKRQDNSPEKRVELHCHTKMSDMDGVSDAGDLIKQAIAWGHKALAITDHGCVQGFTEALHALWKIPNIKELDFKVIYGVEAYLVDDLKGVVTNSKSQKLDGSFVVFDIETTGFSATNDKIIEIGAVKVVNGKIVDRFSNFVNPKIPIPYKIEELTKINDQMVMNADTIDVVLPKFLEFSKDSVMVAHNADFDMSFIIHNCNELGIENDFTYVDTVSLARCLLPSMQRYKLDNVAKALGIKLINHHRAVDDAECTAQIFEKFVSMLWDLSINNLDEIDAHFKDSDDMIKKLPSHHAIIIATNEVGRINLYRLVSNAHIKYYHRNPRIPKSDFLKNREGLIIGSACEAGELYQAVYGGRSEKEIARLVNFYDYLEIQPLGNNMFMVNNGEATVEQLKDINRKIVKLGEQFNKPVVATCDVHFLNPEDEIYRRMIMFSKGFSDADNQAPLYLRTTEEMLAEFEYLGSDKAYEVVVTNTNLINDMVENISPVDPKKAPPVIENSDQMLRDICYRKAHSMYGEKLPELVEKRLERELNSIISNGYAVMYIIAQKLVWKSNEDGYLVGSRGSVGSSFVATMSGITEVNPLKPHYYCAKCHYSEFDSEDVNKYAGGSGCDMPDKVCPECGEMLIKDGFDIPFETFLGFKGNKEPDIDLNFSGEYQSKAHEYTEVIFGKGQTFRAGTIGTLAEKTAYGYVKKYYEDHNEVKRNCEIERIAAGCVGIRRTTGQHPGGIIVLPYGEEIYRFTPVQRPANDMETTTITTHFDYHSIDHNLLKLDILGHDDPTMIRMLEDLTGVDAKAIPLDNKEVMSLFSGTEVLGIKPEDIGGCKLGSLGIPEFGTDFVIQMLLDTKPQTFSDLVRISGLSHGTDVWLSNAQTLIQEGKATISTAICTRDDIMTYLIGKGLESELSFTIMESVRKGKGLKPEWETEMLAHDVPDWYVWSCKKIKYMFPKAHAAAYVMMAYRIAYFKIFHPLAYYAAFFSIRATSFNYELMCQGKQKLEFFMSELYRKKEQGIITPKEEDTIKDMKIVQEMYARGFEFEKLDVYKASASRFQIINGKLMPSLATIDGMGDKAAEGVAEAAKDGVFLSREDFRIRTKVSKTVIDTMADLGLLEDLPESNQLSLFDF